MGQAIISLRDVSYRYPQASPQRRPALSGITLDIAPGEYVAVAGANGSGKSTLVRMLDALLLPTGGTVSIDGLDTREAANRDRIRETVGMVFQDPDSQIVGATVADDIAFGLENLGLPPEEIDARLAAVAGRFGLTELLEREPYRLSGGQKQRTALAGVVALEPRVIVLDEPTSMLDPRSREQFHALAAELWSEGTTIVYVTHLLEELALAGRVIVLDAGVIAFDGTPRELCAAPRRMEALGLEPPLAVRLARALSRRGIELEPPLTLAELARSVCG